MTEGLARVLLLAGLLLLNAFFVAAEFAIVSVPKQAIEHRAAEGHRVAGMVARILRDPRAQDQYLAATQLGITFASLGLGMYGERLLAHWWLDLLVGLGGAGRPAAHALASVLAVIALTYLHIVLGEMVPKALALQRAQSTVLAVTPVMFWVRRVAHPLVVGLGGLANALLRLMGVDRARGAEQYLSPDELQTVIEESREGGQLRQASGDVLQDVLQFGDLRAGQVMVPRVRIVGIPLGCEPGDVREILRRSLHTRYPVYEGDLDHIVGVIHVKDLLRAVLAGRRVEAADTRPPTCVPETATLDAVLEAMRRERSQMAIILDEYGGTAGLVSVEDLLEEVAGDVDEAPHALPPIYRDTSGRLVVDGSTRLGELAETLHLPLEHEEVDTVGGLVLALLGRPPRVGDRTAFGPLRIEVLETEGRGVRRCAVTVGTM